MSEYENIEIIHGDVLKLPIKNLLETHFQEFTEVKVVANLPYYITTPIIMTLLEQKLNLDSITVMIQKEVAERIQAKPGTKDYGSLSLAIQYYAEAKVVLQVPKTVFMPKPNVDSAIIRLTIRKKAPVEVEDEQFFFQVIKASFAQRRKTIVNNLAHNLLGKERKDQVILLLESLRIDPTRRAETLTIQDYANLSNLLTKMVE